MDQTAARIMENHKYLGMLSKQFPSIQAVSAEIINLQAILDLPKGTEHFLSDLHGEDEPFLHLLNNCSGVIREKVDLIYGHTVSAPERSSLATLIYYPRKKLEIIKRTTTDLNDWYRITLHRLIEVARNVGSKYTRSKVRKALPKDFEYIIDELLHTNYDVLNKELYYDKIISTIIDIDRADAFIEALAGLVKRLAVDRLHIVGDIFDRGPRADIIMDSLLKHHSVDIQWGNHDILWMGAAAGSPACIAIVLNSCLLYNNLDIIEMGYGINLRHLTTFAQETYHGDCSVFSPRLIQRGDYDPEEIEHVARLHKAIAIIQFKLEGQLIKRNPDFSMEDRLSLDKIDYARGVITIDGVEYPLKDADFPTIDPADPYRLTEEEERVVSRLITTFKNSEKLSRHIRFLYAQGELYTCYNANLLFHGCVPVNPDMTFKEVSFGGMTLKGRALLDYCQKMMRQAYFSSEDSPQRQRGLDFVWYLWCGRYSPLFGKTRMTTFERYLVEDKSTWTEEKDPYYSFVDDEAFARMLLSEFGLDPDSSHIINGHIPVKFKDGESPIKAGGKLIVIDGGICKAYQPTTGLAGYTLIYNSYGMRLVAHEAFGSIDDAIEHDVDISSSTTVIETLAHRQQVSDIDEGKRIKETIADLKLLLYAYRSGFIRES